jgi:iron complex outermembrane receptor protein
MLVDSFSRLSKILTVAQLMRLSLSNILNKIRMKHFCTFLIIFFVTASQLHAQNSVSLSGQVTSDNHEPVIGATAALLAAADSSLAKVAVSDEHGNFEMLNVKPGSYSLRISVVGYENYRSAVITVDGSDAIHIPTVVLQRSSTSLSEVTVTAQKPMIEVKPGMTVFNVQSSINAAGSNGLELLQKSPGVVVDQNDNIMLKGRSGVQIQIDGRPTQLSGTDLADLLRSMQSTDIDAIEIISNPSAKYDAEGTGGIINIRLKKNKSFGTNGSVTAGYGIAVFPKYNTSLSLNNRNKVANIFGTYSNNWGNRQNHLNIYRVQQDSTYNQRSTSIFGGLRNNFKAGTDFFVSPKHTIGILVTGNISDYHGGTSSKTEISGEGDEAITKILFANNEVDGNLSNVDFNGNYRFADTSGHELTADVDYGIYRNNRNSFQPNTYTLPDGTTVIEEKDYRTISPTSINIYTAKADYSQNLFKGKLGAGFKVSWVKTDNTFDFYNVTDGVDVLDTSLSNHFVYTENTNAAYLNYEHALMKDLGFQAGLRVEQTNSEGDLTSATSQADENVKRHYLDYFPNVGLNYTLDKKNGFAVSYSRRIDRPNYQELNPFEYRLDELSYRKGNPFLDPQYTDKVELSHTYNNAITSSLSYSHTKDFFAQITDTLSGGRSYITTRNLASEDILSLDISGQIPVTKWWSLYASVTGYHLDYAADFGEGKVINESIFALSLYAQNTFTLPKGFSLELSGWYSSPSIWGGTYKTASQGSIDAGMQKKLFKDRGTLKLSITDIFHTAPWDSVSDFGGLYVEADGDWESRQFRATFTYRFGNKQVKGARQRNTGNESETQRLGNGDQ